MSKKTKKPLPTVSVILPMRNASSTVIKALDSIKTQNYPITEVILVDNVSTDNTVDLVRKYAQKNKRMNIKILLNKKNIMVAGSFNRGIRFAKTDLVALMHSDCCYASEKEISKLVNAIIKDQDIVAVYGHTQNPLSVWEGYSFWEKALLSQEAGKTISGLVGKTDCFQRKKLLSIGGYDEISYKEYGGEDADLHFRLKKIGKIVKTDAKAYHLHYLYNDFSLIDLIRKKKATARTYGRLLRIQGLTIGPLGILSHLTKPILALGVFVPVLNSIVIPLVIFFPFWYYQRMFLTKSTLLNPNILLLPFVGVFLVFYETFWIFHAFLQPLIQKNNQ